MTTFYRGPGVRITHKVIEVWYPTHRRYAIRELRKVRIVERPAAPPARVVAVRTGSSGVAGTAALVVGLAWADGWQAVSASVPALVIIVLLAVSTATSCACWLVQPVHRQLVAVYRGRPVSLYWSTDRRAFGQVQRALARALELASDTE